MKRELSLWLMLATLLGGFASPVRAADPDAVSPLASYVYLDTLTDPPSQPNVVSRLVSYLFHDSLTTPPDQPNVVSPLVSYLYYDWLGDANLTFQNSPLVSFFFQPSTASGQFVLGGRVTDTIGVGISGATISATVGLTPVAQTTTDATGNFGLPPLGAGVYALAAGATGHARSARAVTLNAATATQNFQLASLPATPVLQPVNRPPTVTYTTGPMGSSLKVFDGTQFVPITAGNAPPPDRMTIVLTHGWIPINPLTGNPLFTPNGIEAWPTSMAAFLRANGITAGVANIVGWDWRAAATGIFPPENNAPPQGVALGLALQSVLGTGYATNIHFLGHSLGALVNAAGANYLHRDRTAQQPISSTPWLPERTHMTLFDQGEVSRVASAQVLFDGLTLNLGNPVGVLKYAAKTLQGWKPSMPVRSVWADNYISLVGFYLPNTVNVALQKAQGYAGIQFWQAHSYPMTWYDLSIATPTATPLGFQQSHEYEVKAGLPPATFPSDLFQLGEAYHQTPAAFDQLALEPLPPENVFQLIVPLFGNGADVIVQGVVGTIKIGGDVAAEIRDAAAQVWHWTSQGFEHAGNAALQGGQSLVNLFNSAVLRLRLHTTPASAQHPQLLRGGPHPLDGDGGATNSPPMAWLPIQFPLNATAMAFDFMVEGDPVDDVLVCGIGTNNLFTLEAKYIPTNTISASRLIDVSAWAGTTNELFFGFMGGTSTNATLTIENIRFYSLTEPKLEISTSGNVTLLSWPSTAGGYALESTPSLASPIWETATNAPVISADRYVLTNSWNDQTRFFRLRSR